MKRRTLARWLVVSALACFGLATVVGFARADEATGSAKDGSTVQGSNASDSSTAQTGSTSASNSSGFATGPSATGASGANASQTGQNSATVTQSGNAQTGDPVAGGQVTGSVADNVKVQNQNSADNSVALSGDALIGNVLTGSFGPSALITGTGGTAQTGQVGSNSLSLSQTLGAQTGDAVAGSQVTGIVGDGEHTIATQNRSEDAVAFSGTADASNVGLLLSGPFATAVDSAQAGQVGDNDAIIAQSATAFSGDALANSQVAGVVGGSATAQEQNSSRGGASVSGDGLVANLATVTAGPVALSTRTAQASQTGDNGIDAAITAGAGSGDSLAGAQVTGYVGDENGFLTVQNQQASEDDFAVSGNADVVNDIGAIAGPQAGAFGTVSASNAPVTFNSPDSCTATGGTTCTAEGGALVIDVDVVSGNLTASAAQTGDNSVAASVDVTAASGDAVAGSQVLGAVAGDGSDLTVQNQNTADTPSAVSGDVNVASIVGVSAGPTALVDLLGDAFAGDIAADLSASCTAGDDSSCTALGGAAGIFVTATSGDISANASQIGDNSVAAALGTQASSGDAIAGGQVSGAVTGDGSTVTTQNQNAADSAFAVSGSVDTSNAVGVFGNGPQAQALVLAAAGLDDVAIDVSADCTASGTDSACDAVGGVVAILVSVSSGDISSTASQTGDNSVALAIGTDSASGDAVVGAQITGAATGDDSSVTVSGQNSADDPFAATGDVTGTDTVTVVAGPLANTDANGSVLVENGSIDASASCSPGPDNTCRATGGDVLIAVFTETGDLRANASQVGDNDVSADLVTDAASGDAVSGSQVTGAVAGDDSDVTIQNGNRSGAPIAFSGEVSVLQDAAFVAGPQATTFAGAITAFGPFTIDASADCTAPGAGSTCTATGGTADLFAFGAFGRSDARTAQSGDNLADVAGLLDAASGDAVAGSQVAGAVTGEDSDVTVQNTDSSAFALAVSGDAAAIGSMDLTAGPQASANVQATVDSTGPVIDTSANGAAACTAAGATCTFTPGSGGVTSFATADRTRASASQGGDNRAAAGQSTSVGSGDAVSGSQVTGVAAGDGSRSSVQNQNTSEAALSISGEATGANLLTADLGPAATALVEPDPDLAAVSGSAAAQQTGHNTLSFTQALTVSSGDAVGGAQVTGIVGGERSTVSVLNSGEGSTALSGGTLAGNLAGGSLAPTATSSDDQANAQQTGDSHVRGTQSLSTDTGDAVAGSQVTGEVGPSTRGSAERASLAGAGASGAA